MNNPLKTIRPALAAPWIFFVAAFAWTWLFWGIGILTNANLETGEGFIYMPLGVIGPAVAGVVFVYLTRDREGRRDYWKRIVDFRRIPGRWYLVIFLFVPALHVLAALLDLLAGGSGASWGETVRSALTDPATILMSILFSTLIPFFEEMGWRGYVLDRLQEKRTALAASLILGVVWAVWHLPLFFIEGSYQAGLGVGTPAFWLFMFGILPLSLVFTWIYNHTGRSTLAVILFHAMVNFTGELIALIGRADTLSILLWFMAALGITIVWGGKKLARESLAYSGTS
jgi:membrane protease YdiL (CAAX protease family)